jgi:peptide/nickel transport system substrate-binding protein
MISYLGLSLRRRLRRLRNQLRRRKLAAANFSHRYILGKRRQLVIIRRFVLSWMGVALLSAFGVLYQIQQLSPYYLEPGQLAGGRYVEGAVGDMNLINPVLPENALSADVTRLVFSGLLRRTPELKLEGDLASSWTITPDNKTYTFNLRQDVKWHDGVPFTARDVVFTLTAIQNPDSRSPLAASWAGVKAEAKGDHTVVYTLPSPYSAFLDSTVVGLLPSHLLESTDPSALRIAAFNQHPVGTGPFRLQRFDPGRGEIDLKAYDNYHHGRPLIDRFSFHLYEEHSQLTDAYAKRHINGISSWRNGSANEASTPGLQLHHFPLPSQVNLFYKVNTPNLTDPKVRRALSLATDRQQLLSGTKASQGVALASPLLPGQLGYDASKRQPDYDLAEAERLLDQAGWQKAANGTRTKGGKQLRLQLLTQQGDYTELADIIRRQWQRAGVALDVVSLESNELQQSHIRPRRYDVLLYGITIGADPDVYVYWHSSQISDPGLNLSQYVSDPADRALESGRITADPAVREGKYSTFLTHWLEDIPATVLYQPVYIYATSDQVMGISAHRLGDPTDRFYAVERWTVRTHMVPRGRS